MKNLRIQLALLSLFTLSFWTPMYGQLTPSADSYTSTATPTTNYGAKTVLDVESSQTTYIQFDLSAIPVGYTGANITKATLKLYVNAVAKAGSFNVDYVNGTWSEAAITSGTAPALGTTIAASIPLTAADKNQYILIDITPAVQAWLNGSQTNDGIALVGNSPLNASFDSKESTTTSHSAELDIVFAGGGWRWHYRNYNRQRQRPHWWRHKWDAKFVTNQYLRDQSGLAMERLGMGVRKH